MENKRACAQYACLALNRPSSISFFNRHLAILATCPYPPRPVALLEAVRGSQNMIPFPEAPSNLSIQPGVYPFYSCFPLSCLQILSFALSLDCGDQRIVKFDIAQRYQKPVSPAQPTLAFFSSGGRSTTKPVSRRSRRTSSHSRAAMACAQLNVFNSSEVAPMANRRVDEFEARYLPKRA